MTKKKAQNWGEGKGKSRGKSRRKIKMSRKSQGKKGKNYLGGK